MASSDAGFVNKFAGLQQDEKTLLSYLYREPLSPHLAARREKRFACLNKIKADFAAAAAGHDYVLAEGAGGIVCPVVYEDGRRLMYSDIVKALGLSVIVVADAGLGTINHTVLTLEYLKNHGIKAQGVVLNKFDDKSQMHQDNLFMVEELTDIKVIATVAEGSAVPVCRHENLENYFAAPL